ncbi:hypothetical protein EON79_15845 [bacterium]|nr:MAG: hypothetical protein EON79_15845 [bacterium]
MTASIASASTLRALRPFALLAVFASAFASAQPATPPAPPASGQTPPPNTASLPGTDAERAQIAKSGVMLDKFNQIDILGKLLPVALTKEQIRAILPSIQKARQKEFEIRLLDATELQKLEADVNKAVDGGADRNEVPTPELQNRIRKVASAILIRRQIATNEMIDLVYAACQKNLDAGQLKVMASTLKPEAAAPGAKVEGDEANIRSFIRYILLDGLTYDLLRRMSRPA